MAKAMKKKVVAKKKTKKLVPRSVRRSAPRSVVAKSRGVVWRRPRLGTRAEQRTTPFDSSLLMFSRPEIAIRVSGLNF